MKSIQEFINRYTPTETEAVLYCPEHGEFDGLIRQFPGREPEPSACPQCQQALNAALDAERQQQADAATRRAWLQRIEGAGIPYRFWEKGFDDFHAAAAAQKRALTIAQRYAERFDRVARAGTCLVFTGRPGTGKTHLACALVKALLLAGRTAEFTSVYRCLRRIKTTWRAGAAETEQDVLRHFAELDLLALDEVGMQFGSDAEKLLLFEVVNSRYEAVKPTLLISNAAPAELENYLGARLVDRLTENGGTFVSFEWESARGSPA